MKTIAIYSNKGGVGKTAGTVNLSYLASQNGYKTLVCDFDSQSSATYYFRVKPKLKTGVKQLIKAKKSILDSIKGTDYDILDLLPGDLALRNIDIAMDKEKKSKQLLKRVFSMFKEDYDILFVDCPPSLNLLAENIFNVADYILVPFIPTVLSMRAQEQLISFLEKQKCSLKKIYIYFSIVDKRKKLHNEFMAKLNGQSNVLEAIIPYLSTVEKMGIERQPVAAFAPRSVAASYYIKLWEELNMKLIQ